MKPTHHIYNGSCHCGRIRFRLESEPIKEGMRCNCSICRRLNAVMSSVYYPPERFQILEGSASLALYRFPPEMVNHYFCKHCGVYPFHDAVEKPGIFRVNLGCIDEINLENLAVWLFDGRDSWEFLN